MQWHAHGAYVLSVAASLAGLWPSAPSALAGREGGGELGGEPGGVVGVLGEGRGLEVAEPRACLRALRADVQVGDLSRSARLGRSCYDGSTARPTCPCCCSWSDSFGGLWSHSWSGHWSDFFGGHWSDSWNGFPYSWPSARACGAGWLCGWLVLAVQVVALEIRNPERGQRSSARSAPPKGEAGGGAGRSTQLWALRFTLRLNATVRGTGIARGRAEAGPRPEPHPPGRTRSHLTTAGVQAKNKAPFQDRFAELLSLWWAVRRRPYGPASLSSGLLKKIAALFRVFFFS